MASPPVALADERADTPAAKSLLQAALPLVGSRSFGEVVSGIERVTASGSNRAAAILNAISNRTFVIASDGSAAAYRDGPVWRDAVTGETLSGPPDGFVEVRLNNRVRNALGAALGSLKLMAVDPVQRFNASEAVRRARDISALEALDRLVATEPETRVRESFALTRAALIIADGKRSEPELLDAIQIVKRAGNLEAVTLLRAASQLPYDSVRIESLASIDTIERRLAVIDQLQNVWYGLSLGSVLLLAAIGLAITFGVMGVINMAHGEMVMIGAYTTFVVQEVFRAYAPGAFDLSLLVAVPAAFLVAGAVGVGVERGIIRFLYGRPLETLLATWGVSLILQQTVRTVFGPTNRDVSAPSYMQGSFDLFGLAITYNRLWIILFTLVVFAALLAILKLTTLGLQMRAVTQNRRMAASMGIRTGYVDAMTFGLGSGIAGIAGVALSQIDNVSPNLGQNYIIDSFMVVVFGGVGNLWGTLVSAFALGVTNKFLEPYAGAVLAKILILVLLILFIQKRPRGLFALKGR
ncbi:MAG: urea ABC transporter permease subunit UrtB, partial [Hyphomicrobiaceae bacterium]